MRNKLRDLDNSFSHSASRRKGRPGRVVSRSKNVARALNRPVNYTVPGIVPVLAQASRMACWATVFTMLESWRRQQSISIETAVGDVGQRWLDLYNANTGLSSANKVDFVTAAGLIAEPPTNFSVEGWENLLRSYGPIWVTTDEAPGLRWAIHARIITGISGDGTPQGTSFSIIDPAGGRQYREKISVFVPKYEEEVMRTGHTRIQVLHWDQDARSSTQSTTKSFARNVVPLSGAMQAAVSAGVSAAPTDINALVQRLTGEGANEEELRSFLAELNASPATVSAQSGLAFPLGGGHVPITLPGTTLLGRYKAILFRASLTTALAAVPTGAPIAVLVNALPALANRYNVDQRQAARVREMASRLLGQVANDWELKSELTKNAIGWAALLHEIGLDISHSGFQRHGAYIAENADLPGFPRAEQLLLAYLIATQRSSLAKSRLKSLPADWQENALRMSILLRLAVLMNRSRGESDSSAINATAQGHTLTLRFRSGWLSNNPLTVADLSREREYFDAVGYRLDFTEN